MGILDRIFGGDDDAAQPKRNAPSANQSADEAAIQRYRYMLKTAPPETLEQAHAEAFARLTPDQRRQVLQQLQGNLSDAERAHLAQSGDDPQSLARAATRAEVRRPGTIERVFGGYGGGMGGIGFGGMLAGGFLSSLAGTVVGSYIAQQFFDNDSGFSGENFAGDEAANNDEQSAGAGDYAQVDESANDNIGEETGEMTDFGGDLGGDFGDLGEF